MSTLFDSDNPRIAAAQAEYIETLRDLEVSYDAAQVMPDLADYKTGDLFVAVREHTQQMATNRAAARLAERAKRKRRKAAVLGVVVLNEWRAA